MCPTPEVISVPTLEVISVPYPGSNQCALPRKAILCPTPDVISVSYSRDCQKTCLSRYSTHLGKRTHSKVRYDWGHMREKMLGTCHSMGGPMTECPAKAALPLKSRGSSRKLEASIPHLTKQNFRLGSLLINGSGEQQSYQ